MCFKARKYISNEKIVGETRRSKIQIDEYIPKTIIGVKNKNHLSRRAAIKLAAGTGVSLSMGTLQSLADTLPQKENPIILENRKTGSTDWQLTRVRPDEKLHRTPYVEGYCSRQSVKAGELLEIMVSTAPVSSFKIDVYRTGYYGGTGARHMQTLGPFEG